jgi:hypothetical protein
VPARDWTDVATLQQRSDLALGHTTRDDLIRQARRHGLKSRAVEGRAWDNLPGTPLPAIGRRIDGAGKNGGSFLIRILLHSFFGVIDRWGNS